jgi:hypothetical protein
MVGLSVAKSEATCVQLRGRISPYSHDCDTQDGYGTWTGRAMPPQHDWEKIVEAGTISP